MMLVETKLFPGVGTLRPLLRPRLELPRTVLSGSCTVVSVVAAAGYGKSTLLAYWHGLLREQGIRCGWLSLDEDDNDPGRFLRYLIKALQAIEPEFGADALVQVTNSPEMTPKVILESIAGDLQKLEQRAALFLDDLHFITDPEVLKIIEWLVNYAPKQMQFILGSREESRVRLGSLRMRGALHELSHRNLMFDIDEAQRFCQSRLGSELSSQELMLLLEKTEGWPAGFELAALAIQDAPDRQRLIEAFAGSDQTVMDYLGDVVLSRLDEATRRFLFQIALFDRICAPLAQVVTDHNEAAAQLKELHGRNLFLIALDRQGEWFRFHHLVGEFFRRRYRLIDATDYDRTLALGARWLHEQEHVEDAINAAIQGQDWDQACRWLAEVIEETTHRRGYHQVALRWINTIPERWMDRHPTIRVHYAFSLAFSSRQDETAAQLAKLERMRKRLSQDPDVEQATIAELDCAIELQQVLSAGLRDEGRVVRDMALQWLKRWPQANGVQIGAAENVLSYGHKSCAEISLGLEATYRARQALVVDHGYYGLSWNKILESFLHLKRGTYAEARRACESGLELIRKQLMGHSSQAGMCEVILAAIAYEYNEIDHAERHIESGLVNIEELGTADILIMAFLTQARLQFQRGDHDSGIGILQQGQDVALQRGLQRVLVTLAAEECAWRCRQRQFAQAETIARRHGFISMATADVLQDKAIRVGSRLLMRSDPEAAVKILEPALAHARGRGLQRRSAELLLLHAFACRHGGNLVTADESLRAALRLGVEYGYRRLFLDDSEELAPLAARVETSLSGEPEARALARQLLERQSSAQAITRARRAGDVLIEELTNRELKILRRMDSVLSNREIAESIFISEGTLKWHLHNIYVKLGTKNRATAIAKARELRLL